MNEKPSREIAAEVMLRLTPDDFGVLQAIGLPAEPRAHTYLRVAREAVLPPTIMLRYRKPPLFRDWLEMGPLSPIAADARGEQLLARKFEVQLAVVEPSGPRPAWPDDYVEEDPEARRPLGVTWAKPEELGIQRG